jgi:vacuolar-type H+-ATPase subunit D/Vma8
MKTLTEINLQRLKEQIKETEDKINNFERYMYVSDDTYSDFLDEIYGEIDICGYKYYASYALQKLDPIAYDCGFSDYCDSLDNSDFKEFIELENELEELQNELEELENELEEPNP